MWPHPFTTLNSKGIRDRVSSLVRGGLHRTSATNIIFVCGGDGPEHLRPKFISYMVAEMASYRPFRPEAAQEDLFEQDHAEQLNLCAFEELVSDLSLGIVLFAESPGSYAETGLFSALENARKKTLVILNAALQGGGSFLTFGPVATIVEKSRLGAAIQLNYDDPQFEIIRDRIQNRLKVSKSFRTISKDVFSDLDSVEVMAIIWFYVDLLRVCSFEDILFCFQSAFDAHVSTQKIKHILSVLVGAGLIVRDGNLGLVRIAEKMIRLAEPSSNQIKKLEAIRLEMFDLIESSCDANYLEVFANAS